MGFADRLIEIAATIVLIVGGYQFYFWAQRQTFREARYFPTRFDALVSFDCRWVWVYTALYYPMIVLASLSLPSWEAYARSVGCFLALLAVQVTFFVLWPVAIPAWWRSTIQIKASRVSHPLSMRMLDMVWSYDKLRNSLPSMHVSVATMVDLTIWSNWPVAGVVAGLFPILIAASALKTKQHYVVDIVPGALLGAAVFFAFHWTIG